MLGPMVELQNVVKRFGQHTVVHDLSLHIQKGEFLTLLGPSGCGKTTTLRMIAGFEHPTSGKVKLDGEFVQDLPAYSRDVNTVFQSYALFPHLNAYENVAFGLRVKKVAREEIDQRVKQALRLVQLEEYASRKPEQLSGGQRQRIAIARALVNNPKVLLLDEPLGALDQKLRKQMQVELKHLQKQLGVTFVFVTHDQEEALTMSDRIAVMNKGVLEQVGTPADIYDRPATRFVAEFIGETNLLTGTVKLRDSRRMLIDCGGMEVAAASLQLPENEKVTVAIRPEKSALSLAPVETGIDQLVQLPGRLTERIYCGGITRTVVTLPGGIPFVAVEKTDQLLPVNEGDELFVNWQPEHGVVLTR
ncbi:MULTISPECIES: ABC transporter ATP-binding protein [Brevibacillus]|jgi:spermidine/putrescine transport system ATP-binding protein|uniref:Spermidine/putrescine import ATP-binding protein PotA n=1 Tax=Brevibacillus borstelensis AK1 TaxID=1300222 RepID=M8DI83_9BACL|nr:ABC transporter ATP-binding protein [Brevibacillus borstelensis]EMT53288.1 spermidine/putrescine ABC transporter ATP-binding protein [Brevibacillus borstelensis AK1]KKX55330.1 spermidine/putrescine ABC transporter ATP-binding protein [Brevibacillus borstelensis cifa_chp40]MBE5394818.1 ABC transporter ATP-binding protein [Brevibacillus borstelensis]MCC0566102.1 ABC transporter ATP-binding protein [Brevibacillus borstelensis]MCM3472872.1 ABC transporter ATP-binding protein [Brevibacillus bors